MKTIPPWTQTECEQCGCRFHLTRAEPRIGPDDHPELCPECRAYETGLADAEPLPGDPIAEVSCPCCGAHLDITHGDDPGEISVVGSRVPCAACEVEAASGDDYDRPHTCGRPDGDGLRVDYTEMSGPRRKENHHGD